MLDSEATHTARLTAGCGGVQQVNLAIQNGCKLSRATVHRFKHNDVVDLERVLQQVDRQHRAARCWSVSPAMGTIRPSGWPASKQSP